MAESRTQRRGSETDETEKAPAKAEKATARAAKAAKAAPKGRTAAQSTRAAAKGDKPPAKARKPSAKTADAAAKVGDAPASDAKAAPTAETAAKPRKPAAKGAKGAKGASESRKVKARTADDAARDAAPPAPAGAPAAEAPAPLAAADPAASAPKRAPRKAASPRRPAKRKVVEDTARRYFSALTAREPASMASYWRPEGIQDSVPLGVFRGPEAIRRLYQETFTAMPDMRITVERITADDRVAAVQWRATGTFSGGPLQGVEATGRRVELRGTDCLEIDEDGKIVRNTSVYDGAAVARGMGLLPPEDSGAERAMRTGLNTVTKLRRAMASRGLLG